MLVRRQYAFSLIFGSFWELFITGSENSFVWYCTLPCLSVGSRLWRDSFISNQGLEIAVTHWILVALFFMSSLIKEAASLWWCFYWQWWLLFLKASLVITTPGLFSFPVTKHNTDSQSQFRLSYYPFLEVVAKKRKNFE